MVVNHLQEPPAGKPWVNDRVRTWEPAPFTEAAYAEWAAEHHALHEPGLFLRLEPTHIDPLISRHAESDRRRKEP